MVIIKEGVEKFLSEGTGVLKMELFLSFVEHFTYFSKVLCWGPAPVDPGKFEGEMASANTLASIKY